MDNIIMQRELFVIFHGQPLWLRIGKIPVILAVFYIAWKKNGWRGVAIAFGTIFLLGMSLHLFLRYMTNAWTEAWWIVPKLLPKLTK